MLRVADVEFNDGAIGKLLERPVHIRLVEERDVVAELHHEAVVAVVPDRRGLIGPKRVLKVHAQHGHHADQHSTEQVREHAGERDDARQTTRLDVRGAAYDD
ncbi:MAG: hypothetical protein ACRBN8_38090 [Nannocystales bacterium]